MAEEINRMNNETEEDYQVLSLMTGMNRYQTIKFGTDKIANRSVVEITGEAGTGKSKLCYYFALYTILPEKYGGLESSCLFISTFIRLTDEKLREFFFQPAKNLGLEEKEIELMIRKLIYKHLKFEELQQYINDNFEKKLVENRVKTIIIDNISSICDQKFQEDKKYDYPARHKFFSDFFFQLNRYILKYDLFCFCVNEVRASFNQETGNIETLKPTMGTAWENNIGTRLFLKKFKNNMNGNKPKRWIETVFSNFLLKQYFEFEINQNGIEFLYN